MSTKVSKFLIYALVDPRTKEWRYIGKSSSGLTRAQAHRWPSILKRTAKTHCTCWVKSLMSQGLEYEIVVLEEFENAEKLNEAETEWIAEARRLGVPLTNHTDGGEGVSGYKATEETKRKLSKSLKGRTHSIEARAKLSIAHMGKLISDETRAKLSAINKGKRQTEETKAKRSAALRGRPRSEETKIKIANGQNCKPVIDNLGNVWPSINACARTLKLNQGNVRSVLSGKRSTCSGMTFRYL